MHRGRQLLAAFLFVLAALAPVQASASEVPRGIRDGRIVSLTAWSLMGAGAVMMPLGSALTIYDYNGEWQDKWRYDKQFLLREPVGWAMIPAGAITMGASIPFLVTGAMLEARGLHRVDPSFKTIWGWLGMSFMATGGVATFVGIAVWSPVMWIGGLALASSGFGFVIAQFAVNAVRHKRLVKQGRLPKILTPPRKVQVGLGPMPLPQGGGISVRGVF